MAINHVHWPSSTFIYVCLIIFPIACPLSDSEALLRLKQSFTNATALDSWQPGTEPCATSRWIGVMCHDDVVFSIRLAHLGLSGNIDVDAVASISGLRSISFISNAFSGPIPAFHPMGSLKGLYLSGNQFSGEIPSDYFTRMSGLKKVWLSGNKFSGPIPSSLIQLSHLIELHLEGNQFSGTIPPLEQPGLVSLDLSNNNLEGEIPVGMLRFGVNVFRGNPGLCGGNLGRACDMSARLSSEPVRKDTSKGATKISIVVLVVTAVVFFLMAAAIFVMKRNQDRSDSLVLDQEPRSFRDLTVGPGLKGSRRVKEAGDIVLINDETPGFGLGDLMQSSAEMLGTGGSGSSYKATMANDYTVVVKRIKEVNKMGKDQFDAEMRRLGGLKHKNVLAPSAYHYRKDEKLLIYEYQPKGSLMFVLHGDRGISHAELNWPVRFKIIQGIARGLAYIHAELSSLDLPHGDLKSSNVLLTPEYEPLLVDYGLCLFITQTAQLALMAHMAPEAMTLNRQVSPKCDVFCLGIIILEVLTGKIPSQYGDGGSDVVQWVRSAIAEGREADLFDPDIVRNKNSSYIPEMKELLRIGAACTESNPEKRLSIGDAVGKLDEMLAKNTNTSHVEPLPRDC